MKAVFLNKALNKSTSKETKTNLIPIVFQVFALEPSYLL